MTALKFYQRRCRPHPEWVRKLLHMGMGLVTLSFPWLFDELWPILVLVVLSVAGMLALRCVRVLKCGLGSVVGGVDRASLGEVYFPVGVAILFVLYLQEDPGCPARRILLYCIPILLLALGDALAALIGVRFGRFRYPTPEGSKTAEGSLALFAVGLASTYLALLHWGDDPGVCNSADDLGTRSLLIALL